MEELSELEERIMMYFWLDSDGTLLKEHLAEDGTEVEILDRMERLLQNGLLDKRSETVYRVPLSLRRQYTYDPPSIENLGIPSFKPAKAAAPKKRQKC
jgi:hypothetical protein